MGYLVISIKIGQRFKIGENIEILVSDYDGGRVDLAIDAPRELAITRLPTHAQKEFGHVADDDNDRPKQSKRIPR